MALAKPTSQKPDAAIDDVPPARALAAGDGGYTRCWLVSHRLYGALRIECDTEAEAVGYFIADKAPGLEAEELRRDRLTVREAHFRPAETERGKPGGWKSKRRPISQLN